MQDERPIHCLIALPHQQFRIKIGLNAAFVGNIGVPRIKSDLPPVGFDESGLDVEGVYVQIFVDVLAVGKN